MASVKANVIFTVAILFISTVGGMIDGRKALPLQFPYHAYIEVLNATAKVTDCSGAVITSKFVISTYDCLWEGSKFRVKLGSLAPGFTLDLPAYDHITENIPYHYEKHSFDEKYPSLLKMTVEITFSLLVQPVLLPEPYNSSTDGESVPHANYVAKATGYGIAEKKRLEYLIMEVEPMSECRNHFSENLLQTPLCVRSFDHPYGGDKGSLCHEKGVPLVVGSSSPNFTLLGLFGTTDKECRRGGPNLFIKIDRFVNWIQETMTRWP